MSFTNYARDWFIAHLERDIAAHESGRVWDIGETLDEMPEWDLIEDDEKRRPLSIAYNFWDEWIDDRNHGWCIYESMTREQWPIIARQVVLGLREDWTPEQMEELTTFDASPAPPRVSLWQKLKRALSAD